MARIARIIVLAFSAIMLAGLVPQADAQVVVKIGHGHRRHHRRAYYRHGHRYYR